MVDYLIQFVTVNQEALKLTFLSAACSLVPILIWASVFLYKHNEKRELVVRTFAFGAFMVLPFILYRELWDVFPFLNIQTKITSISQNSAFSLPLSLAFLFASLGCIEEYFKHKVASSIDHVELNSIDDAIEFSILAALGFSFAENTFYFIQAWQTSGPDMFYKLVIFRSLFSTFAHILFSSIYGYHAGLALFANPILHNKKDHSLYKRMAYKLHNWVHIRADIIFKDFQRVFGLIIASVFHGAYNILLELGNTTFLIPFLIFGFLYTMKLISDEKNQQVLQPSS